MSMPRSKVRPSGFTLIELMVVVGIIGILSSIAIPNFQRLTLRAKAAERTTIMLRVKQSVMDYYVRNGQLVNTVGSWNPAFPPGTVKHAMLDNQAGWNVYFTGNGGGQVGPEIEGSLYYSYLFQTTEAVGSSLVAVWAYGDLDGDGLWSTKTMQWSRQNGVYQLLIESPLPGDEDANTF